MAVVELERREHIALLTLNRPEARNAISPEVSQTMAGAPRRDRGRRRRCAPSCSPGTGEVFSAGADLKVVAQGRGNDIARGKGGFAGIVTRDFPKPIIAAVNGPALAGGFEIVLSCDLVVAADTARFGIPEVQARADGRGRRADPAPEARAARDRARARDDRRPDRRGRARCSSGS